MAKSPGVAIRIRLKWMAFDFRRRKVPRDRLGPVAAGRYRNEREVPAPLANSKVQSSEVRRAPAKLVAAGRDVQTRAADQFAASVLPIIVVLQKAGVTSLRGIARHHVCVPQSRKVLSVEKRKLTLRSRSTAKKRLL